MDLYLSPRELLAVWDNALNWDLPDRALALLTKALPDMTVSDLASLPIGLRDGLLLNLRERIFGATLECRVDCLECTEALELNFRTEDVRTAPVPDPRTLPRELVFEGEGYQVAYRLPNSFDPQHLPREADAEKRQLALLQRCLLKAKRQEKVMAIKRLPKKVLTALAAAMADADPQADIQIGLDCPSCSHRWSARFDIATYLWREIHSWAQRLLADIHTLAMHYHWSEDQILALSPVRRRFYLGMVPS